MLRYLCSLRSFAFNSFEFAIRLYKDHTMFSLILKIWSW